MRSSRHQVARAASRASGVARRSKMPATSPTSCVSTQRTTSAMVRPSSVAACRSGASILAAVAYQKSPSGVVPSALAASHRSAATRQERCHSAQPVSGDHVLAGAPVLPVGSMHQTRPRRARDTERAAQEVTLDAGGYHRATPAEDGRHRQAGGLPTLRRAHDDEGLGPLGGDTGGADDARNHPEEEPTGRRILRVDEERTKVSPLRPAGAPAARAAAAPASPAARPLGTTCRPATRPPRATGKAAAADVHHPSSGPSWRHRCRRCAARAH